jgi:hypothetical protein
MELLALLESVCTIIIPANTFSSDGTSGVIGTFLTSGQPLINQGDIS